LRFNSPKKRIIEYTELLEAKSVSIEEAKTKLESKKAELGIKKAELDDIVNETQVEEDSLQKKAEKLVVDIDPRLLSAYKRIRGNARNGLSVVPIERDACGGCFNKIPPQHQMEIKMHKKIIVCEYCGRILIDAHLAESIKI
jgi:predicted  nucleic acid-binding Zn-ribbon protein